ncbi:MAG TPA: hypothetical protein VLJ57_16640, partial [Burkholderiaceae bacterium]|nr:hypothetical protein [Burkholderiaceae bacterium]
MAMRSRWLRILAWAALSLLVLASAVLGAAWWWAGSNDSLATVLARASGYLPQGHVLETSEVMGSLRSGGRIGQLRWQNKGLTITAKQVEVGWDIAPLLRSKLYLSHLRVAELSINSTSVDSEPFTPPQSVVLPIEVDIPFTVADVRWAGPAALQATGLAGRYQYDGMRHTLAVDAMHIADGSYSGQATLLARTPLSLKAALTGEIQASVPGSSRRLPLLAKASVAGDLAGQDAVLALQARLAPAAASGTAPLRANPMQAEGTAQVKPWAKQPIAQADARFANINLASLWPDMPQTLLDGTVRLKPEGAGWHAQAQLKNGAAGPWDRQRIPLDSAQAQLRYQDEAWLAESLQARVGPGELRLSGQWQAPATAAKAAWQGRVDLRNIDPARMHTGFATAVLDGHATAQSAAGAVAFDV